MINTTNCSQMSLGNPFVSGCGVRTVADFTEAPRFVVHVAPRALHDYDGSKRVECVLVGVESRRSRDCNLLVELSKPIDIGSHMRGVTHVTVRPDETAEGVRYVRSIARMVKMLASLAGKVAVSQARDARASVKKRANAGKVGTCQICANEHKLGTGTHAGKIVLHGYSRPGYGYTIGSCFGVAELPFELSRDALGRWLVELRNIKTDRERTLAELPKRKSFTVERSTGFGRNRATTQHEITKASDRIGFEHELSARMDHVRYELRQIERDIEMQTARFDGWCRAE